MAVLPQIKTTLSGSGEGNFSSGIASRFGMAAALDFYTYMALIGAAYQVKAGTITTPLVGRVGIGDTAAEFCVDAAATGNVIIPVYCNISFRLAAATLYESAAKSVAAVSTVGTAFVPLPLRSDGPAAVSTARVAAAGGVTVTAELATTTLRHFSWSDPIAAGAWPTVYDWTPRVPPVLRGPRCFYVQIAAATTGPSYYSHFDFLEGLAGALL